MSAASLIWRALCGVPLLVWVAGAFAVAWLRGRIAGRPAASARKMATEDSDGGDLILRMNLDTGTYRWIKRQV